MWITPYSFAPTGDCLSIGGAPSQGLVFGVDRDFVIKVPFQYPLPDNLDDNAKFYIGTGFQSFIAMEFEHMVYDAVTARQHPSFLRRLNVDSSDVLFLERVQPLEEQLLTADKMTRRRWVKELLSGISHLETLGFVHGDIAIRNLAVDSSNHLKIFDFGCARPDSDEAHAMNVERDHSHLATCIHDLLTRIDDRDDPRERATMRQIEENRRQGLATIGAGAEILAEVIQAGWTGQAAATTFSQVQERVEAILGATVSVSVPDRLQECNRVQRLEARCVVWLKNATTTPGWMSLDDYDKACRAAGFEVDMDIWR